MARGKCPWCGKIRELDKETGVCNVCLNKRIEQNMMNTRKQFEKMDKGGALSSQGLCATDFM
jgi:hypothetical protein